MHNCIHLYRCGYNSNLGTGTGMKIAGERWNAPDRASPPRPEPVGAVLETLSEDSRLQELPTEELGEVVKRQLRD